MKSQFIIRLRQYKYLQFVLTNKHINDMSQTMKKMNELINSQSTC